MGRKIQPGVRIVNRSPLIKTAAPEVPTSIVNSSIVGMMTGMVRLALLGLALSACSSDAVPLPFPGNAGSAGVDSSGSAGMAATAGVAESVPYDPVALATIKPSRGCGVDPPQAANGSLQRYTIRTSGTKDASAADSKKGDWSYEREYVLWLPMGYDKTHAYPLVFQAPGCGGTGADVFLLSPRNEVLSAGVDNTVIRVGLTPPPDDIGHSTNPSSGCFDDHEGDDSVEWPFYEAVVDRLKEQLCFDENRVFVSGIRTGATLANELACKYAGDSRGYAIRGVASAAGVLPDLPGASPTCTGHPLAGIWIVESNALGGIAPSFRPAIDRALAVNHCAVASVAEATFEDFSIVGAFPSGTCQKIVGCLREEPLVTCVVPQSRRSYDDIANPAFSKFLQSLAAP